MGCTVVGLDPSAELLAEAKRLDDELWGSSPQQQQPPPPSYVQGKAEATGLPSRSFDVVTAGQCWHWFDSAGAFREVARLLKEREAPSEPLAATPRLVVCHFDWLPLEGGVAQATERLVLKHNPGWKMHGGTGFYPQWAMRAAECGFQDIETFSFVVDVPYSHEAWRGRIRAMAGVAASLAAEQVKAFDEEHGAMLQSRFPEEPLHIPHRVWAMVCSPPSSSSHAE
ncbi:Class I SAM-dependent methyltransferase, variant 2 [Balamuthia mandrillaris]